MAKIKTTEVLTKIVEILTPLSSDERQRVIAASLTLLGEEGTALPKPGAKAREREEGGDQSGLPPRAKLWMNQNSISSGEVEQVFHISDGVAAVIAPDVPGKNNKEKTLNAYALTGISKLLETGNAAFDDKTAKALCRTLGCFDTTNHARYLKAKGNEFTGSKDKGWSLTAPGLRQGAAMVKELGKDAK
jgi:hypothetical protein